MPRRGQKPSDNELAQWRVELRDVQGLSAAQVNYICGTPPDHNDIGADFAARFLEVCQGLKP